MRIPNGEERKGAESLFEEIIAETLPKLGKNMNIQIHEVQRTPRNNQKKIIARHIIIK